MTELIVMTAVTVGLICVGAWRTTRHTRRRAKVLAFATHRGWSYRPFDPLLTQRWYGVPFGRGENREAAAVVRGVHDGRPFTAFEYSFVLPRERVSRTVGLAPSSSADVVARYLANERQRFSVVVVDLPTYLPGLTVVPESVLARAGIAAGVTEDIELESEDFNRRYRVTARSPRAASDILTPRTMQLLLSRPPLAFRTEDAYLISWRPGGLDGMDLLRRVSTLVAVADGVPGFVWTDRMPDLDPSVPAPAPAPAPAAPEPPRARPTGTLDPAGPGWRDLTPRTRGSSLGQVPPTPESS